MATIRPPELTYQPDLPQAAIDTGRISEAQLEVVAYAGQAHSRMLPDGKTRRGYFVGDGTGLGKGTEMAAIILDNWRQGRRKAVWVSENAPLFKDAQRDAEWTGLGKKTIFQPPAADAAIERDEGVLYTTYSQLSTTSKGKKDADGNVVTAPKRRLDQFVEWLGEDFDGVIAFDEAHNMRSAVSVKGKRGVKDASQAALAGIELQQRLPNARVVYASATGATEVMNLGYTERLGLWGEGTPFPKKEDFISDIDAGGVAAMEVVAKDLKAMGMYQARSLSFDGVEYDTLTHGLSANQRQMYDTLAEAWQKILVNIDDAMESSGSAGDGRARAAANSSFWSAQQRFFNQILTALQTPTVIKDIEKQLKAGNSTVMQIVNTDEALAKRRLSQAAEAGMALDQVDLTPRDIIMQFLAQGFPTTLYEQYTDEDGNNRTRPVLNEDDSPVEDPQAVAKRDKLMEEIALLDVPDGALNQIIRHFGPDQVAEITGRSQRVTWNADGEPQLQKFTNSQKDKDARAFERGDKRILIFSDAGGTGRSYHASLGFENQQKRIHYLLQPGWRADKAVQGLGRTHRTNQAQPPRYVLVTTDLVAQKRFMSSIARRLDQLGALTRGQRDTSSQGLFSAENNLENEYGARAANRFLDAIYADRLTDIAPRAELAQQLGLRLYDSEGKRRIMSIEVPQFLNRLLSLKPDMMEKVFDEFQSYVQQQVDYAREVGEYDTGMQDLKAQKIEIANRQLVAEHAQGGTTEYVKLAVTNPAKLNRWKNFSERALKGNRFIKNRRSGKVYAVEPPGRVTNPRNGDVILRAKRIGVNSVSYGRPSELLDESKVQSLTVDEAKALWDEQIKTAPQTVTEDVHLISGALLPIYDRLPDDQPKIIRVEASGERLLGREIPAKKIKQTLKSLGVNSAVPKLSLQQWADAVLNDAVTVELANGLTVKQSTVYGEKRLEVVPKEGSIDRGQLDQLKNQGAVSEIIAYRPRVFLPKPRAAAIMQRMTNNNPIVDYEGSLGTDPEALYSRRAGGGDQSTVDSVQAELRQAFGRRVERLGNVNYVQSVADLPASANAPADTQGLWHRGQIYLVADKILPGSAQGVLLHELVHADLRTNPAYSELMDAVRAASRRPDSPFADALNRVPDDTPARFVAEETLAYAAESNPKLGLVRRLVAMVRNALRKLGLIRGYSDNDLLNYAIDALRRQARGQDAYSTGFDADTVTGATTTADGIASGLFSRVQDPNPDTAEQLLREIDSAYRQRPTLQERVGNIGEWFSNLPAQSRRAWMNLLTRQQIVDLGKDQLPLAERFEQYARRMDADAQAMIQENYDLTSRWSKRLSNFAGKQSQDQVRLMSHTMHEATLAGIDPDKPRKGDKDKDGYDKVMRLWNGMDEQSKEIYRETRDAYKNRREQLERALVMRLANLDAADPRIPKDRNAFYDYAIDVMSQQEGGATRRQILTNMRIQFESSKVEPYFPLSRFGDWYIAATGPDGERSYMMYETEREWKRAQKDLAAEGYELRVGKNVRNLANDNGPGAGFMRQIFDTMDESDIGATAADLDGLKDDLYQLYLMSLPEQSIRKRFIHRKGTRGFSQDALRAFAHHMGHSAKQIARLRYGHTMGDQLSAMKANIEAAPDPAKAADIVQGLQSSYEWMMNPNTATWANRATSIGFVWYLGVSPAAAAVNLTQTAVVTLPVLGAQYGFAKSSKALGKATADYTRYVEKNIRAYGAEKLRNPEAAERLRAKARQQFFKGDEGRMLDELENSGAIDRTLTASVLGLDEGNVDTRQAWQWAMGKVGFLFHQAERWNRETTALAAYRLARDAGKDHERAVTAAYDAIFQSHFDYSSGNRAAFMRGNLPRVFLLFRQYSQNMTYLMGRTLQQSVAGESPEKRREAMKTLGGVLTMTAIMGGAMGLPLFSIVTSAMQMAHDLGDDSDEPYDAELEIRNWLNGIFGEGAGARVARGVFGAGIGTRVSLNELWLRSPNRDLEGKELAGYWLEQAAGPVVGIGINGMRGVDLMTDGQIYRGFETVVPKFVRDVMRGWRYSEEGVRSLRGDEVVGRGDLSTLELFMQAGGITPHQIIERYDQNSALKRAEQKVLNRRRSLMNRYYMAYRDGDRETLRETLQLMQRFNRANPVIAISADSIRRSLRSRARYSGRAQDGIILDRRLRQQLLEQRYVQ